MPTPLYQRDPSYAPGLPDLVPPKPKHEVEERRPSRHVQRPGPKGRTQPLTAVCDRYQVPTLDPAPGAPLHPRRRSSSPPAGTQSTPGWGLDSRVASDLLGTRKQFDTALQYQALAREVLVASVPPHADERLRVADVLDTQDEWHDRADRMRGCEKVWGHTSGVSASASHPEKAKVTVTFCATCKDGLCRRCRKRHAAEVAGKLRPMIETAVSDGYRPIFMTVTQRDRAGESLGDAYARLSKSWAQFIRSVEWKSHVDAALLFVDVTCNNEKNWWHVHGHALLLVRENFWERDAVIELWKRYSGAWNVDLRYATPGVEEELAPYGMKLTDLTDEQILEYAAAMKGKRLIRGTGLWKGGLSEEEDDLSESAEEEDQLYGDEEFFTWEVLLWRRDSGDEWAAKVLAAVKESAELYLQSSGRAPPS